jgi:1-acyl-sn-glycerol-3-phosphate acyltransferase
MRRQMAGGFRATRLLRPGLPDDLPDAPLVVYSNHPGWWDPIFFIVLQRILMRDRQGFGPIDAAALERYGFMKKIGILGVEPDTRAGAVRFLKVGAHLLSDPRRMIWMTAQGRFADPRERPVTMKPGLAHLLARVPGAVALPLALEYPFWSEKRPEALACFGTPIRPEGSIDAMQTTLERGLEGAQDRLATAAQTRDPAAFETLIGGGRGVGGIYGAWTRAKAMATGRRYDPDHLPDSATD